MSRFPRKLSPGHPLAGMTGYPADDNPADYLPMCGSCNREVAEKDETLCRKCAMAAGEAMVDAAEDVGGAT